MHIYIFIFFLALAFLFFFFSFYHQRPETCAIFSIMGGSFMLILAYQVFNLVFTEVELTQTAILYSWSWVIDPYGNYTAVLNSSIAIEGGELVARSYADDYYLSPLFYALGFLMLIKGLVVDIAYLLRRDLKRRSEGALS